MKLKRIGVSVAAVALAFTAGCGGDSGGEATPEETSLTQANFASAVTEAHADVQTAHVEAKIEAQGQQFTMNGDVDGTPNRLAAAFTMSGQALGGNARFILVDKVMYLQIPGMTPNNKYIKFDLARSDAPGAAMLSQLLDQVNQLDPSKSAEMFKAITRLQERGTEEIDGVQTTHYTVDVDTQKALEVMGLDGTVPQGQMPKTLTEDVWLDSDNRMRRIRMNMQGFTMDMTYSQWGEPVDISAPPASQTTDMRQMMSQMGGAPGS